MSSSARAGGTSGRALRRAAAASAGCALVLGLTTTLDDQRARAQDAKPEKKADKEGDRDLVLERSRPLRTALHHDPTLGSPLERLYEMFRDADRVDELVGMYRSHLNRYPRDLSARTVYVRLLLSAGDGEGEKELRRASAQFPKDGYLAYLRYSVLAEDNDPRALDLLDRAVKLERRPVRKRAWTQRLLELAVAQDRRDLARKHLKSYASLMGSTASAHLTAARKMQSFGFHLEVLEELAKAKTKRPSPEAGVDIDLLGALAEVSLKRPEEAAKRLDALLQRLTADYWRRPEILRQRARLITSSEERSKLIKAARQAWIDQGTPSKALDLSRLLSGFDRRREALEVILEASRKLPEIQRLEKEAMTLFDRLREERGRIAYLDERLKRFPERLDLAEQRMRSLFMLGRNAEGQKALSGLISQLSERDKVKRLAETARFLRAQAYPSFAAEVFERAVILAPKRLDLRRELAETLIAIGERGAAHAALRRPFPPRVDPALFLDLVQLMVREELYRPARISLRQQLESRPEHFGLLLALLEVEGRLGNGALGRKLVERTRALADNQARYRRWLEAGLGFYEYFFHDEEFFAEERKRFSKPLPWTKTRQQRLLAFADLCASQQRSEELGELLVELLKRNDMPKKLALEMRRRVVAAPAFEPDEVKASIAHLELLAKEDPTRRAEYRARLAVAYAAQRRGDKARTLLEQIDPSGVRDGDLIRALVSVAREFNDGERALALLARLTEVDAGDREAWERYAYALAAMGDEARLRGALHQILRAGPKLPLKPEVRRTLRSHLADSGWRSVSALLQTRKEADLLEALGLLDQVERTSDGGRAWVWVAWARAYAYNALERKEEREAALEELTRAFEHLGAVQKREIERKKREAAEKKAEAEARAKRPARRRRFPLFPAPSAHPAANPGKDKEKETPTALPGVALVLPDGLCASPEAARAALTRPLQAALPPLRDREGPLNPLEARWAFDTLGSSTIVSVQPLGTQRLLISDADGNVYAVERGTGKLAWVLEGIASGTGLHQHQEQRSSGGSTWTTNHQEFWPASRPLSGGDGSFYLPLPGKVIHYDRQGKVIASVSMATRSELQQAPAPPVQVAISGSRTFVFEPCTGQVAALERKTSKLLWLTDLPRAADVKRISPDACGISLASDRLFVYGAWSAVLDAKTGKVGWSFEAERVREAGVRLTSEDSDPLAVLLGPALGAWARGSGMGAPGVTQPKPLVDHTRRTKSAWNARSTGAGARLVSPAVIWARSIGPGSVRRGEVVGSRLVLLSEGGQDTGMRVLDLDLPMFSRAIPATQGAVLGGYGDLIVLLQPSGVLVLDLEKGQPLVTIDLSDLAVKGKSPRLNGCLDGPLVYVSGAKGVVCANVVTGTRLFLEEWPEGVGPSVDVRPPVYQHYGPGGLISGSGNSSNNQKRMPTCGLALGKELFVTSDPSRLVALGAGDGSAQPAEPEDPKTPGAPRDR